MECLNYYSSLKMSYLGPLRAEPPTQNWRVWLKCSSTVKIRTDIFLFVLHSFPSTLTCHDKWNIPKIFNPFFVAWPMNYFKVHIKSNVHIKWCFGPIVSFHFPLCRVISNSNKSEIIAENCWIQYEMQPTVKKYKLAKRRIKNKTANANCGRVN